MVVCVTLFATFTVLWLFIPDISTPEISKAIQSFSTHPYVMYTVFVTLAFGLGCLFTSKYEDEKNDGVREY